MFDVLTTAEGWMSLLTLIVMEIILGVDNIIFISILADKLPKRLRPRARIIGLSLALIMRVLLLFSISWLTRLTTPLLTINEFALSARDLILFTGGVFLLYKTVKEIHNKIEGLDVSPRVSPARQFGKVIFQIILIDMVFSVDSILTAVGLVDELSIMILAVVVAIVFMMLFAGWVSAFIDKNPTFKMLALSFLLMVGFLLVADGLHYHIDKKYLYFSMGFAFLVEFLNMRERHKRQQGLSTGRPAQEDS
ncbi:MAG: TerC family protein [Chitinophagales bacterium]|nr:TerC family protein [Chitinophagales bacterium]MDW8393536.1 TerC family protein [Chitinophagales bacterium]